MAKYDRFDPRNKKKNVGKGKDKVSNPQDSIKFFISNEKRTQNLNFNPTNK
jgi:hypothetical protein